MVHTLRKLSFIALFFFMAFFAFALAPYPSAETAAADLKANWKIQGEQGTWVSAQKTEDWAKKVIIREKVQVTLAIVKYSVRIEFPFFFRDFNASLAYIYANDEWIYDSIVIGNWVDEQKEGVVELPPAEDVKAMIKEAVEKEAQSFFDAMSTSTKPVAPVKVAKVLITEPEVKGEDLTYFADIEFTESKSGLFSKPKTFIYENLKVELFKQASGRKLIMRTYAGELKIK